MRTFAIEFGWCGWGAAGGLVPEMRLGWVRLWTCQGSVVAILARSEAALRAARDALRGDQP